MLRFFGTRSAELARWFLSLFFLWMGALQLLSPRAALHNSPLDFVAQVLSIASIGRVSFAAAPHWVGLIEITCAILLVCFPTARATF